MTSVERADKLLDDTALLLFGVKYVTLDHILADEVMSEVLRKFDPKMIDAVDAEE